MIPPKDVVLSRIMAKVEKDPITKCWVFVGHWYDYGQGRIKLGATVHFVRKVMAWIKGLCELWDGIIAHRTCTTAACCNPRHLRLSESFGQAQKEMWRRGLIKKPKRHLNSRRMRCIRILLSEGRPLAQIAADVEVSVESIEKAIKKSNRRKRSRPCLEK